jgi:hypothetical protein
VWDRENSEKYGGVIENPKELHDNRLSHKRKTYLRYCVIRRGTKKSRDEKVNEYVQETNGERERSWKEENCFRSERGGTEYTVDNACPSVHSYKTVSPTEYETEMMRLRGVECGEHRSSCTPRFH